MNIETERAWHARQLVSELTLQELISYDGIVAVGGAASGYSGTHFSACWTASCTHAKVTVMEAHWLLGKR